VEKMMGCFELVMAAFLALPTWRLDSGDSAVRVAQYATTVQAVCAATESKVEQAFLIAQAWHETKLAEPVVAEQCHRMPKGERCDEGQASGPWQVHRWCRAAWDQSTTRLTRFTAGAKCALRGFRRGSRVSWALGFQAQRSSNPVAKQWAIRRAKTMATVLAKLRSQ
jgi:hypothetical protein